MDSVPVGRYIPSGCVSRADVQCLVILGSSACGLGIRATPAEEMFLFTALMFVVEWIGRKQAHGLMIEDLSLPVRYVIYTVLLIIIYGFDASNPQGFIYFQF